MNQFIQQRAKKARKENGIRSIAKATMNENESLILSFSDKSALDILSEYFTFIQDELSDGELRYDRHIAQGPEILSIQADKNKLTLTITLNTKKYLQGQYSREQSQNGGSAIIQAPQEILHHGISKFLDFVNTNFTSEQRSHILGFYKPMTSDISNVRPHR